MQNYVFSDEKLHSYRYVGGYWVIIEDLWPGKERLH